MSVSVTFTFDDTWVARIAPVVQARLEGIQDNPVVLARLAGWGVGSVWDLTPKQKFKLVVLYDLLRGTASTEGNVAGAAARESAVEDVENTFPLEVD